MLSLFSIVHSYPMQHFRHTRLFSNQQVIKGFAILELNITYGIFRLYSQSERAVSARLPR